MHMHAIGAAEEITLVELTLIHKRRAKRCSTRRFLVNDSLKLIIFLSAQIINLPLS